MLGSMVASAVLSASFLATLIVAKLGRLIRRRRPSSDGGVVVTGTFYNRNWFLSHAQPLAVSRVGRVVFVADGPQEAPDGIAFECPPRWMSVVLGRAVSKFVWMLIAGVRWRPNVFMGYHLFPGAMTALLVGRLLGRATCYQMTGGPIEFLGGGCDSENRLTSRLRGPSVFLERLALRVVREFDLIVVRGERAKRFLLERGFGGQVAIITGTVESVTPAAISERCYDLIFVGRLTEIKQPQQFVSIVAEVAKTIPKIRAVVIGEGPEKSLLERQAEELGVADNVSFLGRRNDVLAMLNRSKVFVMTSRSEGMSIAMAEAMACGLPAVVSDVGELGELVRNDVNGWLISFGDTHAFAERVIRLLTDDDVWRRFSDAAIMGATQLTSVENVARRWNQCLCGLSDRPPPLSAGPQERLET